MRTILILIIVFLVTPCYATDYYVKTDGNDSNDGSDDANAWQTLEKITDFDDVTGFSAGDNIYFKKGHTWDYGTSNELLSLTTNSYSLYFTSSGSAGGGNITFGTKAGFGTGNNPKFSGWWELTGVTGDWSDLGSNKWERDYGTGPNSDDTYGNMKRIRMKEGTDPYTDWGSPATVGGLDDVDRFHMDDPKLTVYSVGNPATTYASILGSQNSNIMKFASSSYITIDGLDFEGGAVNMIYWSGTCENLIIQNCSFNNAGWNAMLFDKCKEVLIDSNDFLCGWDIGGPPVSQPGTSRMDLWGRNRDVVNDAMQFRAYFGEDADPDPWEPAPYECENVTISNCTFSSWDHDHIGMFLGADYGSGQAAGRYHDPAVYHDWTITGNTFTNDVDEDGSQDSSYIRALDFHCDDSELSYNKFSDLCVHSQLSGQRNEIFNNIWLNTIRGLWTNSSHARNAAAFIWVSSIGVWYDNKVYNNTFKNYYDMAILSWGALRNEYKNNVFIEAVSPATMAPYIDPLYDTYHYYDDNPDRDGGVSKTWYDWPVAIRYNHENTGPGKGDEADRDIWENNYFDTTQGVSRAGGAKQATVMFAMEDSGVSFYDLEGGGDDLDDNFFGWSNNLSGIITLQPDMIPHSWDSVVDQGTNTVSSVLTDDFDGNTREGIYDIGAYEYIYDPIEGPNPEQPLSGSYAFRGIRMGCGLTIK